MPRLNPARVLLCAALSAASCGSPGGGKPRPPVTYVPPTAPRTAVVPQPKPQTPVVQPSVPQSQQVPRTNPPASVPPLILPPPAPVPAQPLPTPAQPAITGAWISLDAWSQLNHLGQVQRVGSSTNTFQLHIPGTNIILTAGSQLATCNGMKFFLGFAPQLSNRQLFVHSLDAQKNLLPLLSTHALPPHGSRVVVIDPGHGGDNAGTKSVFNGKLEKEYTLDWAKRLKSLLEQRGWKVILTRTTDASLGLQDRVAFANRYKPDLFISLHFNSPLTSQSGLETYCLTPAGMPSNLTRDFKDDPTEVFTNNHFDRANLQYAARLHRSLASIADLNDRGVRRARFMAVLRGQNCPAVLIEGGYLSNRAEAKLIADPSHRNKLALAVAKALE